MVQVLVQVLVDRLVRHLVLVRRDAPVDGLAQAHNHLHRGRKPQYIREHGANGDQIIRRGFSGGHLQNAKDTTRKQQERRMKRSLVAAEHEEIVNHEESGTIY